MSKQPIVLITGVTGGLGAELLPRLLKSYPHHKVVALIRADTDHSAAMRLADVMLFGALNNINPARVQAVSGDVCAERLGLSDKHWKCLLLHTEVVFHLAANVGFSLSLQESRLSNVISTRRILDFCRACIGAGRSQLRLNHVSTAYVCGKRQGLIRESQLHTGQQFWNAYEQSKAEAEQLVADCRHEVPSTIYRPSQIIGDSSTGRVKKYFGLYEILKLGCHGKVPTLPGNATIRQDFVPVDYVCDAIVYLSGQSRTIGQTFHLAAGLDQSLPLEQALQLMYTEYVASREGQWAAPMPQIQQPEASDNRDDKGTNGGQANAGLLQMIMKNYLPYLSYERNFDMRSTRILLTGAGIKFPPIDSALRNTVRYALASGFR